MSEPVCVLYEDRQVVLCLKPVGLSSQEEGMVTILRQQLGGSVFPVHRLDLNVGGLMVYARTKEAATRLSQAIGDHQMDKCYLALVSGTPEPNHGIWEDWLFKDSRTNKVFPVDRMRKGARDARLEYWVLGQAEGRSLVQVRLFTGRSHQIRVQFASRKHPLVGDHKYGSREPEKIPALWSYSLGFPHPASGKTMTWTAPPEGPLWEPWVRMLLF